MTRRELLKLAQSELAARGVLYYRLEAELLLRHVLKIDPVELLARPDVLVPRDLEEQYRRLVARCAAGEPSFYIIGHREFYGLDFEVNKAVLIPRPETELIVEIAMDQISSYPAPAIADIGTGSGVIAVTLAKYLPQAEIYATDISHDALIVARSNSRKHGVASRIHFLQGNLLEPLPRRFHLIVANLPYVPTVNMAAVNTIGYEPEIALHGGSDGLDLIKQVVTRAREYLLPDGFLLLEVGIGQKEALRSFVENTANAARIDFHKDLSGIDRVARLHFHR